MFDAHTHIGANDPDGYSCSRQELVGSLGRVDASAFVFPMHEPDGYPAANDMVIAEAAPPDGRLFPFCRLDPHDYPLAEARRCLDAGARGIKLHPRAEAFNLDHPDLQEVFALAEEVRLPILCHAGRGIPALGRHSIEVCSRYPDLRLILAHAGISDLAWIWREAPAHPNLFFDTSWWSPSDMQALFALVPPGQILMASDAPYGTPAFAATMAIRHGLQVGLSPDALAQRARRPGAPPRRARAAARPRTGTRQRVALARPPDRARLLVPAERDRPDVRRGGAQGDARPRRARLPRARGRRTPRCTRRSLLLGRARATTRPATAAPAASRRAST